MILSTPSQHTPADFAAHHPPSRRIAVGDIHGCLKPLEQLIEQIAPDSHTHLIFLGDYIDRGPDPRGVIEFLLELRTRIPCTFLMGNHEQMMLEYLDFGRMGSWRLNGGDSTLASYTGAHGLSIPPEHRAFIGDLLYYYDAPEAFYVHGGIRSHLTVAQNLRQMTKVEMVWERDHLEADRFAWEKPVVCGHTPVTNVILRDQLICIDTGCVFNTYPGLGKLTAIEMPERTLFQVTNRAPAKSRFF